MYQPYVLNGASDFRGVVEALDRQGVGFVAITDESGKLQGVVTDGDIRRAVLRGDFHLENLINKTPEVMSYEASEREIVARLKSIKRRSIPLVDENNRLVSVFSLDDIEFVSKDNTVVIMAGGLGTRLGELTKSTPKPMLHVGEKPMLQHLIEMFSDHGYNNFILCVNYKKDVIKDYFGSGKEMGVHIEYLEENKRLGTAGALSLIETSPKTPFFVINADILTTLDFDNLMNYHNSHDAMATMCVRTLSYEIPYGVVRVADGDYISGIEEKPVETYRINSGIYVFDPEVLKYVPKNSFFDMPSLFELLIREGEKSSVYDMSDYWLDIGKVEDFNKANLDMARR